MKTGVKKKKQSFILQNNHQIDRKEKKYIKIKERLDIYNRM